MKVGLVLEGGAMRGMYTAGVLDMFLDHNISVDGIIGVSAGVLFGVNYPSKQRGRVIRYNKRFAREPKYMGMKSFLTTGNIINKDLQCEHLFENATNYVKVTINTNNYYGDLKVSWNEDFSPDNTHPMMKNWNDSTKTGTLSVAEQNSYELIFFKNSPSANYVSGIQVSLEE